VGGVYELSDADVFKLKQANDELSKVDRLEWPAAVSTISYGVRVGVRVNSPEYLDQVLSCLPPGWKPSSSRIVERIYSVIAGPRRLNRIYCDGAEIAKSRDLKRMLDALESELQLFVAEYSPRRVFIHAGVVGWRGKAIIIPGRSYSGKTTLVKTFVEAGATYYSDEYAVLDSKGFVHPYPRALGVRETDAFDQTKYTIESLGGIAGRKPLPVAMVIVSQFKKKANWRPQRLSPGQGTLALLANAVAVRREPELTLTALQQIAPHAEILKGKRGEARPMVDSILGNWNQ
jgi:hypothetical protein